MFRSIFGRRRKKEPNSDEPTLRSADVGDVVVVSGFWPMLEDAYFVIEARNRYESDLGEWFELIGADGEKRASIDWTDSDGMFVTVTEHTGPLGLGAFNLDDPDMVKLDDEHSIENFISYDDERFFYRNSFEASLHKKGAREGEGLYMWEFSGENGKRMISIVKYEGVPFEGYVSEIVPPDQVSVYNR